jgi:Zn-dependent protease with chaperone function
MNKKFVFIILMAYFSHGMLYAGFIDDIKEKFSKDSNKSTKDVELRTDSIASLHSDLTCQNFVEPYDYVDIATSMSKLVAKTESVSFFGGGMDDKQKLQIYKNGLKQFSWLPVSMENELGEFMHGSRTDVIPNSGKNTKDYQKAQDMLKELTLNVKDNPYEFKIYLIRGNDKSMEALPGGRIYMTKSALKDTDYAKIAMGHEISHSMKRHSTMQYQTLIIDAIDNIDMIKSIRSSLLKSSSSSGSMNPISKVYGKVASLAVTKEVLMNIARNFTKSQELEADSCALKLLGNDPNLVSISDNFYKNLSKSSTSNNRAITDFSLYSHPSSQERLDNIKSMVKLLKEKKS